MKNRILHIADLHLKHKHSFTNMLDGFVWDRLCQEKLDTLKRIPILITKYRINILTIGGDIFDTSNPPEALKAEFCKFLNSIPAQVKIKIIPGRTGDHDFVAENNYVLMDIKEAYSKSKNIEIFNTPECEVCDGVKMVHCMMDGINDLYKNTVPYDDERFQGYKTILLGDYHSWYKKKFGNTLFLYPGAPYPTRYGETNHHIAIIDVDDRGNITELKKIALKTYSLLEFTNIDEEIDPDIKSVIKYKLSVSADDITDTLHQLQIHKRNAVKDNILDIIWELKSKNYQQLNDVDGKPTLREVCLGYIKTHATKPKATTKLFRTLEASL